MTLNDRQWQRVARGMDGEGVELSAEERSVLEEVRAAEQALLGRLDVTLPAGVLAKAERRMTAELARPRRGIRWVYGAVAAAAVVLIVAGLLRLLPPGSVTNKDAADPLRAASTEQLLNSVALTEVEAEVALLDSQLSELEADLWLSRAPEPGEAKMDSIEQQLDDFWLDGGASLPEIEG